MACMVRVLHTARTDCEVQNDPLFEFVSVSYKTETSWPDGGMGRRWGLKNPWWVHRVGSSPTPATKTEINFSVFFIW